MIWPNEKLLAPAGLAANGRQTADEETLGPWEAQHSPQDAAALILALAATDAARAQLARYALVTDTPAWEVVEAADLLDAVADRLTPADYSRATKCARAGEE